MLSRLKGALELLEALPEGPRRVVALFPRQLVEKREEQLLLRPDVGLEDLPQPPHLDLERGAVGIRPVELLEQRADHLVLLEGVEDGVLAPLARPLHRPVEGLVLGGGVAVEPEPDLVEEPELAGGLDAV